MVTSVSARSGEALIGQRDLNGGGAPPVMIPFGEAGLKQDRRAKVKAGGSALAQLWRHLAEHRYPDAVAGEEYMVELLWAVGLLIASIATWSDLITAFQTGAQRIACRLPASRKNSPGFFWAGQIKVAMAALVCAFGFFHVLME